MNQALLDLMRVGKLAITANAEQILYCNLPVVNEKAAKALVEAMSHCEAARNAFEKSLSIIRGY